MEIYTHYKRPPRAYQPHGGRVLLERQGYVSAKDRIEAIMQAGKRLIMTRGEQFDFKDGEEIDEDYYDPTRSKGYDMVDAFRDGIALEERFKEVQKQAKIAKGKKDESQNATEASKNATELSGEVLKDEVVKKVEKP